MQEEIPSFGQIDISSLDLIGQQITTYFNQINTDRDNLMRHNDLLQDEIRLQKQQSGNDLSRVRKVKYTSLYFSI